MGEYAKRVTAERGGAKRPTTHPNRTARRAGARERQQERARRGPAQQLHALDYRLGPGAGAKRERKRLVEA